MPEFTMADFKGMDDHFPLAKRIHLELWVDKKDYKRIAKAIADSGVKIEWTVGIDTGDGQ